MAKWTEEGKDILKRLVEADKDIDDILKVFPTRTKHGITQQITAMGLKRPFKPDFDVNEFKKLMGGK